MFTLKTGQAKQYLDDGVTFLAVPFEISNEDSQVVYAASQSFPLDTSAEDIKAALAQALAVYTDDSIRHEANKEQQAALDASAEVVGEISHLTMEVVEEINNLTI